MDRAQKRELNVSYHKGGSGSTTPKVSLPTTWIRDMGFTKEDRIAIVSFDGEKITIEKKK